MKKKKNNSATIGFWLVLGASKEHPLIVCPSLISEEAIQDVDSLPLSKVWKIGVQIPFEAHKDATVVMVTEIINIVLDKNIKEYVTLWDIQQVKAKCESLATKFIEQLKTVN